MESEKKQDRSIHGRGHKVSPNMHRVVVYLYNPARKDSPTGKGSKDFKTTHTFRDIYTSDKVMEIVNSFADNRRDGSTSYSAIKRAYYNGKLIISEGKWVNNSLVCT